MRKQISVAVLYTLVTAVGLGLVYPLLVTAIAQLAFHDKANGQLLVGESGEILGSRILGQPFTGPGYFHCRPSAAGAGYDATASSGSNLGPTSKTLVARVAASAAAEQNSGSSVPVDLVTASGSGLDPDITLAAALYQAPRVARERRMSEESLRTLVLAHLTPRQFGLLGEPRLNVLELNLSLRK
jgi:K+-transporting ATPase ATPase C chain